MKTNWTHVLIGAAVILAVVYYLKPSQPGYDGFEDLAGGGLVGLIIFIAFLTIAFIGIMTSRTS